MSDGELTVLVCGSRDWSDRAAIREALAAVRRPCVIVHGGARGADTLAGQVAQELGMAVHVYPADWQAHGRAAGPIRNQLMLESEKPDLVIAFRLDVPSPGTDDMVRRARKAGVKVDIIHPRAEVANA